MQRPKLPRVKAKAARGGHQQPPVGGDRRIEGVTGGAYAPRWNAHFYRSGVRPHIAQAEPKHSEPT